MFRELTASVIFTMSALAGAPSTWADAIKYGLQCALNSLPESHPIITRLYGHGMSGSKDVETLTYKGDTRANDGETQLLFPACIDFMLENLEFPLSLPRILKHCQWTCVLNDQGTFCDLQLTIQNMEAVKTILLA